MNLGDLLRIVEGGVNYPLGRNKEGLVLEWKGIVWHGTEDYDFFRTLSQNYDIESGKLQSLNQGRYFSTTPRQDYAHFFGDAFLIEFKFDGLLYYAPVQDVIKDRIKVPAKVDAVVFPEDQMHEDLYESEIAVLSDSMKKLTPAAVLVAVNGSKEFKRYPIKGNPAGTEWQSFLGPCMQDVFGKEIDELVEEYSESNDLKIETEPASGIFWIGKITFDPNNRSGPEITYEGDSKIIANSAADLLKKIRA